MKAPVKVLVVDVGGTGVKRLAKGWEYDVVSIGYPGPVREGRPAVEPHNPARGWVGFDFPAAFGCPVKMLNDAAMQALGSYRRGTMLFLGLGTGLGSALVVSGTVVPLELAHLSIGGKTFEDELGIRGLKRLGRKKWQKRVEAVTKRFVSALLLDDVVLGGGNAKKLTRLPMGCRMGDNAAAVLGGFRLWERARK
jgi:polyphosphate glucokinase